MTNDQKDRYIRLLENFKAAVSEHGRGWTKGELKALMDIQEFEDSLPCNQDDEGAWTPQPGDVEIVDEL
jgi:hypothetical protein